MMTFKLLRQNLNFYTWMVLLSTVCFTKSLVLRHHQNYPTRISTTPVRCTRPSSVPSFLHNHHHHPNTSTSSSNCRYSILKKNQQILYSTSQKDHQLIVEKPLQKRPTTIPISTIRQHQQQLGGGDLFPNEPFRSIQCKTQKILNHAFCSVALIAAATTSSCSAFDNDLSLSSLNVGAQQEQEQQNQLNRIELVHTKTTNLQQQQQQPPKLFSEKSSVFIASSVVASTASTFSLTIQEDVRSIMSGLFLGMSGSLMNKKLKNRHPFSIQDSENDDDSNQVKLFESFHIPKATSSLDNDNQVTNTAHATAATTTTTAAAYAVSKTKKDPFDLFESYKKSMNDGMNHVNTFFGSVLRPDDDKNKDDSESERLNKDNNNNNNNNNNNKFSGNEAIVKNLVKQMRSLWNNKIESVSSTIQSDKLLGRRIGRTYFNMKASQDSVRAIPGQTIRMIKKEMKKRIIETEEAEQFKTGNTRKFDRNNTNYDNNNNNNNNENNNDKSNADLLKEFSMAALRYEEQNTLFGSRSSIFDEVKYQYSRHDNHKNDVATAEASSSSSPPYTAASSSQQYNSNNNNEVIDATAHYTTNSGSTPYTQVSASTPLSDPSTQWWMSCSRSSSFSSTPVESETPPMKHDQHHAEILENFHPTAAAAAPPNTGSRSGIPGNFVDAEIYVGDDIEVEVENYEFMTPTAEYVEYIPPGPPEMDMMAPVAEHSVPLDYTTTIPFQQYIPPGPPEMDMMAPVAEHSVPLDYTTTIPFHDTTSEVSVEQQQVQNFENVVSEFDSTNNNEMNSVYDNVNDEVLVDIVPEDEIPFTSKYSSSSPSNDNNKVGAEPKWYKRSCWDSSMSKRRDRAATGTGAATIDACEPLMDQSYNYDVDSTYEDSVFIDVTPPESIVNEFETKSPADILRDVESIRNEMQNQQQQNQYNQHQQHTNNKRENHDDNDDIIDVEYTRLTP